MKRYIYSLFVIIISGGLAFSCTKRNRPVQVYYNAMVYTAGSVKKATAIVVSDGKFIYVGNDITAKDYAEGDSAKVCNMGGRYILPGFIDNNSRQITEKEATVNTPELKATQYLIQKQTRTGKGGRGIAVGNRADFIVTDKDAFSSVAGKSGNIKIQLKYFRGKCIFHAKQSDITIKQKSGKAKLGLLFHYIFNKHVNIKAITDFKKRQNETDM
ncbi:MAG: hypothetical protein RR293_01550 [Bacteroidales bacterium]